jgi:hypothetical protein
MGEIAGFSKLPKAQSLSEARETLKKMPVSYLSGTLTPGVLQSRKTVICKEEFYWILGQLNWTIYF